MSDLFNINNSPKNNKSNSYDASNIEVLEGLEPVRKRPGMYIGGVDENAFHHLVKEIFDNSMDEAVAGYATDIEIILKKDGKITISDNGRGIPIDPHPKFPNKSALEVILTNLHSGGKFDNESYKTAGGLHGVGISVVNALSDFFEVKIMRNKKIWRQEYSKGLAKTPVVEIGNINNNQTGTIVTFHPDPEIFGNDISFKPKKLYDFVKAKAYLFKGMKVKWQCDESLIKNSEIPESETIHFPNGIIDYLTQNTDENSLVINEYFKDEVLTNDGGKIEWVLAWTIQDGFTKSYCNTIETPQGGTHENGFKSAIIKSLRIYGDKIGNKKSNLINIEDVFTGACVILSIFITNPQFQGQTKEKLVNIEVNKIIESIVKDRFENWLNINKNTANILMSNIFMRLEERLNKKTQKEISRKLLTQKMRLPGKLTDCSRKTKTDTEIFFLEGDSAAGSGRQARNRETQAILPLRGKILNVANSTIDKIRSNQEITDIEIALGCGSLENYNEDNLRYEKVIIMTDADVDGAHIAALLLTYFFKFMPKLIENNHLYIAKPPLYKLTQSNNIYYVQNDSEKDKLMKELGKKKGNIEISRFKGLGEMTAAQLKETTMDPDKRTLIRVTLPEDINYVSEHLDNLMGRKAEYRFNFIQSNSLLKKDNIIDSLDL